MKRLISKPKIAMAVIVSLLALSLPSFNLPRTQAMERTATERGSRQLASEPQLFEQRRSDGEVLGRLRIAPAESSSAFTFHVEDLQAAGKADGTVEITSNALKVRFKELGTKTRFGMDLQPDQQTPGRTLIVLSHNKKRCEVAIDGERAMSIATQMQELLDQGKQAEAKKLIPAITQTFSGRENYLPFARQIAKSPAFGILSATASIKDSLNSEEAHKNLPLHLIGLAVDMLAPGSAKKTEHLHPASQTSRAQQPRLIKTSFNASVLNRLAGLSLAQDAPNCGCCDECDNIFYGWILGCMLFLFWCVEQVAWDDDWGRWWCEIIVSACIAGAIIFHYWCTHDGCGSVLFGDEILPFCTLGLCP